MHRDGKTPKLVQAGRVLVDTITRGKTFRAPAGQSKSAARSALWRR